MDAELPEPPEADIVPAAEVTDEESDTEQEGDEEVEKVVDYERHADGKCDYKLKWKGHDDPKDDTWHHEDSCTHCQKIITKFWQDMQMSTAAMKDIEMLAAAGAISPSLGPRAYDSPDSGTKPVAMMATPPTHQLPRAARPLHPHSPEVMDDTCLLYTSPSPRD